MGPLVGVSFDPYNLFAEALHDDWLLIGLVVAFVIAVIVSLIKNLFFTRAWEEDR